MLADVWELKHTTFFEPYGNRKSAVSLFYLLFTMPHLYCKVVFTRTGKFLFETFCSFLSSRGVRIVRKSKTNFFSDYHGPIPKPDLYKRYIDDCAGVTSSSREGLLFITSVSFLFLLALKYTGEISENSFVYLSSTLNFQSTPTVYLLAYTTNELMLITICCIGPFIHITLKLPFHFLNFS